MAVTDTICPCLPSASVTPSKDGVVAYLLQKEPLQDEANDLLLRAVG
ncbi:hypothetical protein [Moraxella bovis]|nr:hypothetical protein [Moraxella bovis]